MVIRRSPHVLPLQFLNVEAFADFRQLLNALDLADERAAFGANSFHAHLSQALESDVHDVLKCPSRHSALEAEKLIGLARMPFALLAGIQEAYQLLASDQVRAAIGICA
jgi:hypothetical protein